MPVPASVSQGSLPELQAVQDAIATAGPYVEVRHAPAAGESGLPVYDLAFGNPSPHVPAVGFFGGVHGLERIGAQVVIAWLQVLAARLRWDEGLHRQLECVRVVVMPLVNPGGLLRHTRANPNGVDLMRNAPVEATGPVPPLVGGQRISAGLPWYRGRAGSPMEPESSALCRVAERELHGRPFGLALDCHSGFGLHDRLWFPYAHSTRPIEHLPDLDALHEIFQETLPHHPYTFEPQSRLYLAHGDLWDHLYLRSLERDAGPFLPLTLEMGSWLWVKKNPRQLFTRVGIFNPLLAHRHQRVLRRHLALFDFLLRAAASAARWLPLDAHERDARRQAALRRWYGEP